MLARVSRFCAVVIVVVGCVGIAWQDGQAASSLPGSLFRLNGPDACDPSGPSFFRLARTVRYTSPCSLHACLMRSHLAGSGVNTKDERGKVSNGRRT
jgi:hypothetical protein